MIALRALQGFTGGVLNPDGLNLIITMLRRTRRRSARNVRAVGDFRAAIGPLARPSAGYLPRMGWQTFSMSTSCPAR